MASDFYAVVEPLDGTNTLTETITLTKPINVAGIRFLIHMHNNSAGTFSMTIKSGSDTVYSETMTAAEINTAYAGADSYYGVWYKLDMDQDINLMPGTYTFNFTDDSGYTFTDDVTYTGWVKPHENNYITTDYVSTSINKKPFGLEIWSYQHGN